MSVIKWLDKHFEEVLLVFLLFAMMMIMGIQVAARYVLGNSLSWSEEITRFCFIWTGFLSISYCISRNVSIKIEQFVDLFKDMAGGKGASLCRVLVYVVEIVLFAYLIPFAYHYVHSSYEGQSTSPACGIPMWMVQSITLICFILCEIRLVEHLVIRLLVLAGKIEDPERKEEAE